MLHTDVYEKFKEMFPDHSSYVDEWFPNGKNSVRVRIKSGSDFIFTYNNVFDWCYETTDSFINKLMKGGQKMNARLHDSIDKN